MDMLQLVFGFVNAPLFATFLLGMFWKRATGHGAFLGLVSGTLGACDFPRAVDHGKRGARLDQGRLDQAASIPIHSEMGQNFWIAIIAWTDLHGGDDGHLRWPPRAPRPTRNSRAWFTR